MSSLIGVALFVGIYIWLVRSKPNGPSEAWQLPQQGSAETPNVPATPEQEDISATRSAGWLIKTLRYMAGLILLIFWPIFTFILPFTFDDPTAKGALGRVMFFVLYFAYPFVFYFSGVFYKTSLSQDRRASAILSASFPILFLALFSLVVWATSFL